MRGPVIRLLSVLVAAGGMVVIGHVAAYADTVCQQTNPATGQCLIWVEVPGSNLTPGGGTEGHREGLLHV
jgi:hypothetical protein